MFIANWAPPMTRPNRIFLVMIRGACTALAHGLFVVSLEQNLLAQLSAKGKIRDILSSVCSDSFHSIGCSGLGFTAACVCSHPASLCRSISDAVSFRSCPFDIVGALCAIAAVGPVAL